MSKSQSTPTTKDTMNNLFERMEDQAQQIKHNYGRRITVENKDGANLPQLVVSTDQDIIDEIVTVITQKGFEAAYANFDENKMAFVPRDQKGQMKSRFHKAIDEFRDKHDLTPKEQFNAYKLDSGWEVHLSFIGGLTYEDLSDNNVLLRCENIKVTFRGIKNGRLVLGCENTT